MSFEQVDLSLPDDFNHIVRLFPLPNLVLFPGVIQALHLFEPRYRQMMSDALVSDELISMALIQPGWKSALVDRPDLCRTLCVGKIVTHTELEDGRYNLLLIGVKRAKIVRELDNEMPYRMAEIELLNERAGCTGKQSNSLRQQVVEAFRRLVLLKPQPDQESLDQFLEKDLPLGQLLDLIGYSCGANPVDQQAVLDELDICRRAEIVLDLLCRQLESRHDQQNFNADFPPDFSVN